MAAAEYFSNAPMGPTQHASPYQRPQYAQTSSHDSQPSHPPPPYHPMPQEHRPSVHFAEAPPRPQRNSFSSQAPIPVLVEQQHQEVNPRPYYSPQLQPARPKPGYSPQMQQSPRPQAPFSPLQQAQQVQTYSQGYPSQDHKQRTTEVQHVPAQNPQYLGPFMQPNHSQYVVNGYTSDPEPHRRRRRRHSTDNRDDRRHGRETREDRTRKERSRSTNADGFLGAAGGGLIGDLIFPGLGTIGGAVAGWIGGKDYGKHRKTREERLEHDQERWEQQHRQHGDERPQYRSSRERRSYERHKHDYE